MFHPRCYSQTGFSLIEMIVALAVFSIVITTAVGALLMLVATNQQLQAEQSVMTNLSFALDSMTREIRTGSNYFCGSTGGRNGAISGYQIFRDGEDLSGMNNDTEDCSTGRTNTVHGIAFLEGGESITGAPDTRIVYFFDESEHKIYRRISGEAAESIVSSGIYIVNAEFYVSGSDPLGTGDEAQPSVTIFIEAKESVSSTKEPHTIQTTITQRTLDI